MHFQGSAMGRNISKTVFRHTSIHSIVSFAHILDNELFSFVRQIHSRTVTGAHRIPVFSP